MRDVQWRLLVLLRLFGCWNAVVLFDRFLPLGGMRDLPLLASDGSHVAAEELRGHVAVAQRLACWLACAGVLADMDGGHSGGRCFFCARGLD
jgi:hypothetical protein